MILRPPRDKVTSVPYFLEPYYPYRMPDRIKPNPARNAFTFLILDVKSRKQSAIDHFVRILDPLILPNVTISCVPSSKKENSDTGIRRIAQQLAKRGRIDATSCLIRTITVDKKASGGLRKPGVDLNSIKVENNPLIAGKEVLLLDDVTSTGFSFVDCRQLLIQAGASVVQCFALGKTTR